MTDKAEDKGHDLTYDWQISCQYEEEKVIDGISLKVLVHPGQKVWINHFDAIKDSPEG